MILIHSEKNFQTLENQIRILKAKGLVIQNPSVAKKCFKPMQLLQSYQWQ